MPYMIVTTDDNHEFRIRVYPLTTTNTDADIAHILEQERLTSNNARAYYMQELPPDVDFGQARLKEPLSWQPEHIDIDACRATTAPMTTISMPFVPLTKTKRKRNPLDPLARAPFPEDHA